MTDLTPAQELRAAAEKLKQAATDAEQASPGPWRLDRVPYEAGIIYAANDAIVVDRSMDDADDDHGDMPYLTLMHPAVGLALAGWLEQATRSHFASMNAEALAVARAILTGGGQ